MADPTLSEIQETLVKMGDKQTSFSGSKQWIGSFEICLFLDHRYGVGINVILIDVIWDTALTALFFRLGGERRPKEQFLFPIPSDSQFIL